MGDDKNPTLSLLVYAGDLGLDSGAAQSIYVLDKSNAEQVKGKDGKPFRVDIQPGQTVELPDGLGSITFEGVTFSYGTGETPARGSSASWTNW